MEMLDELARVLKPGAELRFATDDKSYLPYALERLLAHPDFAWTAQGPKDWKTRPEGWPPTRYEAKAIKGPPSYLAWLRRTPGPAPRDPGCLVAQRIAEAFLDRPGADFAPLVDGEIAHLFGLGLGLLFENAFDRSLAGGLRLMPWRINSTTRNEPTLLITSSPTPVEVAPPTSLST